MGNHTVACLWDKVKILFPDKASHKYMQIAFKSSVAQASFGNKRKASITII